MFKRLVYFNVAITGDFEHFQCLNFEASFLNNEHSFKKPEYCFSVGSITTESARFSHKMPLQNP